MHQMFSKDTTWNQHGTVGATLLANWVEERAVGEERIIKERNVPYISRQGHANILEQDLKEDTAKKYTTVSRLSYQPSSADATRRYPGTMGKLRTMKEREWTKESIQYLKPKYTPHPPVYESTTAASHFRPDFHPSISPDQLPPAVLKAMSTSGAPIPPTDAPITFWSHHMSRGAHTTYASTPHGMHPTSVQRACVVAHSAVPDLQPTTTVDRIKRGEVPPVETAVTKKTARFGRHTEFSTPIETTLSTPHK
ncbi:hypothetical protein BCR44DRAFT_1431449 [Catenaria anguillulae PL171]|uniref:Uncharacterized protein n=1 Tax=Catenaria anguillulae PL171 TaxID=765915 RepID=A0A1Y2HRD9_9FUNG|nr:hypothetical protein BCR44DRAFT_1431449 [Catenaria anguillulae PL171]